MTGPVPIRRGVYTPIDDEISAARFSESARTFFIVLCRLKLVSIDTTMFFVVSHWRLEKFGRRWFERRPFS
jgi:hypothetical protein